MSVAELPPPAAPLRATPTPAAAQRARFAPTYEQLAYAGLLIFALLIRLWGLGDRSLHHDETLHAAYSWQVYTGQGFIHDPLLHGPFLYHIVALMYFLFGDSDFTARLSVALFGTALVGLPFLIRRELGRSAALMAAFYLAISPVFLYISRFIRHDMYSVVFELLTIISIVRYASTRQARWLYIGAAALGLMISNMETFYLFMAIIGSLLGLVLLWRLWRPGLILGGMVGVLVVALVFVLPGKPLAGGGESAGRANGPYVCPTAGQPLPPDNPMLFTPGPIFGWAPLATADNDYALCVRNQYDDNLPIYFVKLGQFFGHPAILLAIVVALGGIAALYWLIGRQKGRDGLTPWQRARANSDDFVDIAASLGQDRRVWVALATFLVPYTLLFTAFFGRPSGVVSGATGSLLYWLAQHGVQRGSQPNYYYLVQLVVYEPLLLLWGGLGLLFTLGMAVRRLRRATWTPGVLDWSIAMPLLLSWWALTTFALYSWAGEKMPWLTVHVALPLVLLGAWAFARVLRWWRRRAFPLALQPDDAADGAEPLRMHAVKPPMWDGALRIYLALFGVIGVLFFLMVAIVSGAEAQQAIAPYIFPGALLLVGVLTLFAGLLRGWNWAVGALALALTLFGTVAATRNAYQLSYRYGDDARELMIFVQTSPDVSRIVRALDDAATRRSGNLKIWYDNETVWQWYMRNFKQAERQQPSLPAPGDDVMAVLMLQENIDNNSQNLQALQGFRIQRYPLRWWNPEYELYRLPQDWTTAEVQPNSSLLMRLLRTPLDGKTASEFWQYMLFRRLPAPLGSTDFVVAVRPELGDEMGLGTGTIQK
jgi:predicted membrane-bound mannosyltransferase